MLLLLTIESDEAFLKPGLLSLLNFKRNIYQVAKIPTREVDHEEVKGFVDSFPRHCDNRNRIDQNPDDGDAEAGWTVQPKLHPSQTFKK